MKSRLAKAFVLAAGLLVAPWAASDAQAHSRRIVVSPPRVIVSPVHVVPRVRVVRVPARVVPGRRIAFGYLDVDRNGVLERWEWPGHPRAFRRLDRNRDGVLVRREVSWYRF